MSECHIPNDRNAMSLDALSAQLDRTRRGDRAPQSAFDALHYELRTHGLAAFEGPNCRFRLVELSAEQLRELIGALIRIRAKFAAVTDELLIALDGIRRP
jgi:hypothetical protein